MKSIKEIKGFNGKRVLIRVDWNVPFDKTAGSPTDDSRVVSSLETIKYVLDNNGKIVLMSHFGREGDSMDPVFEYAKNKFPILKTHVEFLPNLRIDSREEENDESFAKELASKGDIYVNEAFSVSHRSHASVVGVPNFVSEKYAGINFMKEVENLSRAFNPLHPFLFILGGAKLETKIPLMEKFLNIADSVFVGGTLATPASADHKLSSNPKIFFPLCDYSALDADSATVDLILEKAKESKFVLWNGPLGNYENGYTEGTKALAKGLADLHENTEVIVGGGDTLSAIKELNIEDKFTFVSTAGGAMLDFLANGTLPGIEALK